jgi:tetratricopeptide (TPR) repeat protein
MHRYFLLILIVIFSLPSVVQSQTSVLDSLRSRLSDADGLSRAQILLDLAELTQRNEPDEAIAYTDEILELLKEFSNSDLEIKARNSNAWAHIYKREYDAANFQAAIMDSIARTIDSDEDIAKANLILARVARQRGEYEQSVKQLESALERTEKFSDSFLELKVLNELGSVNRRLDEIKRALIYHMRALDLSRHLDDKVSISTTLSYIGIIHDILDNYDESLKYQQQTLAIRKELNDRRDVAASLTNIGIMHQKTNSYDDAMRFYREALAIWEELDR